MRWFISAVAGAVLPLSAWAHPVGEAHRTIPLASAAARHVDHRATMDVTIWYPAAPGTRESAQVIGPADKPYFRVASVADDAAPASGRRPVILLSHGFGGTARIMGWLGAALARAGYVVISVDHPGNSDGDMSDIGSIAWWERPRDMIAALTALERDTRFGPLIDPEKVGAAGFSIGGMTILRWPAHESIRRITIASALRIRRTASARSLPSVPTNPPSVERRVPGCSD